ncbi:MAG: dolichyl-phosphate beta-glucosyltransferase [Thermoanaerobaculia bacterium]
MSVNSDSAPLGISIVIPAFNEERRLPESVRKVATYMREHSAIRELILVDDGSRDGTAALIRQFEREIPGVRAVSYFPNGGKGYAIRRGVLEASPGLAILITDADMSTPIEDLGKLIPALSAHDVAIGSRALEASSIGVRQALYRQFMGKMFNRLMRIITGIPFDDTQCGFKLFSARSAKPVFAEATVDRFAYDVEAIIIASRLGFRVTEVPVRWNNDADSRVRILRDSFRMLFDILRIRLRVGRYRR